MNKIYLAMADVETVDRAFSDREKARNYVRSWMKNHIYYKQQPEKLELHLDAHINECPFNIDSNGNPV